MSKEHSWELPTDPISPGAIAARDLQAKHLTLDDFANLVELDPLLAEAFLAGAGRVTPELAEKLSDVIEKRNWLEIDAAYRKALFGVVRGMVADAPASDADKDFVAGRLLAMFSTLPNIRWWLESGNKHLNGRPVELVRTAEGFVRVRDYLDYFSQGAPNGA